MRFVLPAALMPAAIMMVGLAGIATPARAQTAVEGRVDRLEREMKAVQRKVFPGGSGQLVEPDITQPQQPTQVPGSPFDTNLEERISALESQITTLTGQIEQLQHKQRQDEDAYTAGKRTIDARLKALEDTLGDPEAAAASTPATTPAKPAAGTAATTPAKPPVATSTKPPATTPAKPAAATGARADLVAAVEKPDTGDAAEDQYTYGYRLWQAKLYPEARTELGAVVSKYPKSSRASFAQNLYGRAFLDEGKSQDAAKAFYDNYVKMPEGPRAADSLYYLSKALQNLKAAPAEICKVYKAIDSEYAGKMSVTQQADIDRGKASAKCK